MATQTLSEADQALIERYIDAVWMERGLSQHSLDAYTRDLRALARYLLTVPATLLTAEHADLIGFLASLAQANRSPRSQARMVSSARGFYR